MNETENMQVFIRADEDQKCLSKITSTAKPGSVLWCIASAAWHKSVDTNEPAPVRKWEQLVRMLIGQRRFKKCDNQLVRCAIARLRDARRLMEGVL